MGLDGVALAVVDGPSLQVGLRHAEAFLDFEEPAVGADHELGRDGGAVRAGGEVSVSDLSEHVRIYVKDEPGALVFPGVMGGPMRRGNFNKMSAWPHAVESIGMPGLHFHDLRHTGNQFASESKAGLKDLIARMGHDSERAAMIYQHKARGADKAITNAIDAHVKDEQRQADEGDGATGTAG